MSPAFWIRLLAGQPNTLFFTCLQWETLIKLCKTNICGLFIYRCGLLSDPTLHIHLMGAWIKVGKCNNAARTSERNHLTSLKTLLIFTAALQTLYWYAESKSLFHLPFHLEDSVLSSYIAAITYVTGFNQGNESPPHRQWDVQSAELLGLFLQGKDPQLAFLPAAWCRCTVPLEEALPSLVWVIVYRPPPTPTCRLGWRYLEAEMVENWKWEKKSVSHHFCSSDNTYSRCFQELEPHFISSFHLIKINTAAFSA